LEPLTNKEAKRYYLTYYSGDNKKNIDFAAVFSTLVNYIKNVTGIQIEETNENRKEFLTKIDENKNLAVDLDELNKFFNMYINIEKKEVRLDMAGVHGNAPSEHAVIKLKMKVVEDFAEFDPRSDTEGILKKGEEKEFEIPDGKILEFGRDPVSDHLIPLDEIDLKQFSILNFNGKLYLIDQSNYYPTRIKVQPGKKYVINEGDFISFGLEQDLLVLECKNEKEPRASDDNNINLRFCDDGLSEMLTHYLKSDDRIGNPPYLKFEGKKGEHDGEIFLID
jgi:hypothetical protein